MNSDQMFDDIRTQMRENNIKALEALSITLKKCNTEIKPYFKGENVLYVRCDLMPFESIETIAFLSRSNNLKIKIVAKEKQFNCFDKIETISVPYIQISDK